MVGQIVFLDGTEGAKSHVQEDFRDLYAHALYFRQKFLGEVQSRGGRGGGAVRLAVDRLIAVRIFEFFMDIRRKRHGARAGHDILEYAVE